MSSLMLIYITDFNKTFYMIAERIVKKFLWLFYSHCFIIFWLKSVRSFILDLNKKCWKSLKTPLWASQHIFSSVSTVHCLMMFYSVLSITSAPDFSTSCNTMCQSVDMQGTSHLMSFKLLWLCMPQQIAFAWCLLAFFRTESLS